MEIQFNSELKNSISREFAWHYRAIPKDIREGEAEFFISDLKQIELERIQDEMTAILGKSIQLTLLDDDQINRGLNILYRNASNSEANRTITPNADFIHVLIEDAQLLNSSDIHIEKYENQARIRLRVDGKLMTRYTIETGQYNELINRVKIRANLDISEKRLPQDGRIQLDKVDIRVSILPTLFGEKVVMRLLSKENKQINLRELGMTEVEYETFTKALQKSNGIVLISGPTGSGKTTTLYGALQILNQEGRNILTIEDPVEYTIEGINQVHLNESIGLTFAKALKSFLRQDPDVIMIGEIRDPETAAMSARASLTGHLVLSTIHTNSAWGSISRLQDMDIPSYLLASTINLSIAQRLVRVLCKECKVIKPYKGEGWPSHLDGAFPETIAHPIGCEACHFTGYRGRRAIYEMIPIDEEFKELIINNAELDTELLKSRGLKTLRENAIEQLCQHATSLEEIINLII